MDELQSVWNRLENTDDLKQKLLFATMELESVKALARDEMKKNREYIEHLQNLLTVASKERDEYKNNLQMLLGSVVSSSPRDFQQTESNSLSEVYNHHSHGSPGVDSILDGGSSPEFPPMNMADSCHMPFIDRPSRVPAKMDRESAAIENLAKGLILPAKGKLLSSVMEAGPLLQSLLVAGSLPQWKNPPPLQPFKIPPVSMAADESPRMPVPRTSQHAASSQRAKGLFPQADMVRSSLKVCSASLLDFSGSGALGNMPLNHNFFNQIQAVGKRPRLQ